MAGLECVIKSGCWTVGCGLDNIKMNIQEVGCWSVDWIELTQDRDRWRAGVNAVMNLQVP